jgi:hypothetical protein
MATYNITANNLSGAGIFNIFAIPDSSAQDFINATGIADTIQQNAICDLVRDLKNYGLWSKMRAIYPFVTDNRNLLGYTENLSNSAWSKDGATINANNTTAPDGTNTAWRITRINTAVQGFAIRQSVPVITATQYIFSVYLKAPNSSTTVQVDLGDGMPSPIITLTTEWQLYTFVRSLGGSGAFIDFNIASGDGSYCWFWHPQLELGSTATTYQPILTTQQAYISSQFKFNLKDPRDLDAAFRLVFNGGWTFSSTGATPNGTNGYADTKFNPSLNGQLNSAHLSYYSRTNNSTDNQIEIGANAPAHFLCYRFSSLLAYHGINSLDTPSTPFTPSTGLFVGSRINSTTGKFYTNGSLALTDNKASTSRPNQNISLGALNNNGTQAYFTTKQSAFATIGDGLTDTEAVNLYTAVQAFQTSLSRQV